MEEGREPGEEDPLDGAEGGEGGAEGEVDRGAEEGFEVAGSIGKSGRGRLFFETMGEDGAIGDAGERGGPEGGAPANVIGSPATVPTADDDADELGGLVDAEGAGAGGVGLVCSDEGEGGGVVERLCEAHDAAPDEEGCGGGGEAAAERSHAPED